MGVHLTGVYLIGVYPISVHLTGRVSHRHASSPTLTTDRMQPFYLVVRTYLRHLVVAGISHFGAKSALALLSGSPTAGPPQFSVETFKLHTISSSHRPHTLQSNTIDAFQETLLVKRVLKVLLDPHVHARVVLRGQASSP